MRPPIVHQTEPIRPRARPNRARAHQTNEVNSILAVYVDLLGMRLDQYVYLSQVFLYVPLLVSVPAAWLLDRFGVRLTVAGAVLLAALRNTARALLFSPDSPAWHQLRYLYWCSSSALVSIVVTIYYCLPLKVSESWFDESERSLALTLVLLTPTVGSALAQLVVPHYVTDAATAHPLAYVNVAAALATALVTPLCVTSSRPAHAPSQRNLLAAKLDQVSMGLKLKRLATDRNVMIQMLALGTFDALLASINLVMQDILAAANLNRVFCGQFLASMALVSFVIQMLGSLRVAGAPSGRGAPETSPTRATTSVRVCKLYLVAICAAFLVFAASLSLHQVPSALLARSQWWLVVVSAACFTALRCWAAPHFNELTAHLIAGSVSEATLSAATTVLASVLMNVCSICFVRLRRVRPGEPAPGHAHWPASSGRPDYLYSVAFAVFVALAATCLYVTCFDGRPRRQAPDERHGGAPAPS